MRLIEGMHLGALILTEDAHVLRGAMIGGDLAVRGDIRVIVDGMIGGRLIADGAQVTLNGMASAVSEINGGRIAGTGIRG
ncbi:MAG: hypothetical protein ACK5LJ_11410 [Paracoccus sp. (in: a-proteobacteria)]